MNSEALVTLCLTHLQAEDQLLVALLKNVSRIRDGLLENNRAEIESLVDEQSEIMRTSREIRAARDRLRKMIANMFGLKKQDARLSVIHDHVSADAKAALNAIQDQIRRHCETLNGMLVAVGNISLQRLEVFELFFQSISNVAGTPRLYEPTGRRRVA